MYRLAIVLGQRPYTLPTGFVGCAVFQGGLFHVFKHFTVEGYDTISSWNQEYVVNSFYGHENETSNGGRGGFVRKSLRTKENERYSEHKAGKTKRARS